MTVSDFSLRKTAYYVINIVQWKRQGSPPSYQVASNEWYLFNTTDSSVAHQTPFGRFSPNVSADTRIFGSKNIGFLAIHLRPSDVTQEEFRALQIAYDLQVQETQAANVQDLMALISLVAGFGVKALPEEEAKPLKPPPPPIGLWGGGLVSGLDAKMLPFNITFQANVKFQTGGGSPGKPPPATPAAAAGGAAPDQTTNTQAPKAALASNCDSTIDVRTNRQSNCSFSQQYADESLYHWDVGGGVPFNAVSQLSFSSTDGTITGPKSNATLNAYAFFDIYLKAIDLKSPPL